MSQMPCAILRLRQGEFSEIFQNITLSGCYYHRPIISRSIQRLGLVSPYSTIANLRNNLRMLSTLTFCPVNRVVEISEVLENEVIRNFRDIGGIRELKDYCKDHYIGRVMRNGRDEPRFSKDIWNHMRRVLQGLPRMNNSHES
ncbi:hypothetical protein RF11_02285 [Thelohanellus kitauei]|uniref:Uncharacterized protein n=1 Tax=Thelohanellus kitauei TaxID=669202 RepID=A0A0C2MGI9_THEKT|nr:hypothetical protein RF11_02285 [Thelohanellus kitauei]